MTAKELLRSGNIRALLCVFFNLSSQNDNDFIVSASYRQSKFLEGDLFVERNNELMNAYFGLPFIALNPRTGNHIVYIKKSKQIRDASTLLNRIYQEIQKLRINTPSKDYNEAVIMALFLCRGSVDFNRQLYAVDLLATFKTDEYMNNIFSILSGTDAITKLNFNYREFQPQFRSGDNERNAQIRISLGYLWNHYSATIAKINKYRYEILNHNLFRINTNRESDSQFVDRIMEYIDFVYNKSTTLRPNWIREKKAELHRANRDITIVSLARELFTDECAGCHNEYPKEARSFKLRNQERFYFEINHVIPFSEGKEHDQLDNLVKLCPVCHRALTKNRAEESLQKHIINNMLNNAEHAKKYVQLLTETEDQETLVNFVYDRLA